MLGGADNPNGELLSYIIGADNPDSLTIARDICPALRAEIQRKITTVCGSACSLDAFVKLISNADAAR